MKRMKTNLICVILVGLLGCFLWSCKKSDNNPEMILDKNLLKSAGKYRALMEKRTDGPGNFTIEEVERNGNILTITVKGGCKEEDFSVVWDGSIAFSNPGQVNLVLNNTTESDCDLESVFNIRINLNKIIKEYDPKDFIFNVANGSMNEDMSLSPDGSVTTK